MAPPRDQEEDAKMASGTEANTDQRGASDTDFSESGDLTGDGGVVKEVLKHGEQGWMKPENGDEIFMHYRGTLLQDGSEFDCSYSRSAFSFKLGEGNVIKGWDIVGKTMAKGEKAKITLKPEYAYGETGSPPKIPKNATLVFEMELIKWVSHRDIFGDQLAMKSELNSGDGWERPGKMAEVTLNVKLVSLDNNMKDLCTVYENNQFVTSLNCHLIPEAWEKVIPDMKKNSVLHLTCKGTHLLGNGIQNLITLDQNVKYLRHELTLVSWKKIEDVSNDGNIIKKVVTEGEGWERPSEGAIATVNLKMFLYDSSSKLSVPSPDKNHPQPIYQVTDFKCKVADGVVIDGIDKVIQSMKLNEEALVYIKSKLGYLTAKNLLTDELTSKGINENSNLLVNITLKKFEKSKDVWSMSYDEKIEEMIQRKIRGNELFKDNRYGTAKKCYDRAITFFDSSTNDLEPDVKQKVNKLLVSCHLNLAMCYDRMNDMTNCLNHCKKALEINPSNIKALYRQGCAYLSLDDFYNAQSSLKYAKELDPSNVDVTKKLKELKVKRLAQDAQDKKLFSNLFGRMSKMEEKEFKKDSKPNGSNEKDHVEQVDATIENKDSKME